jgi:hypothetical protein
MATYDEAADANELIAEVARWNNTALASIDKLAAIRTKLVNASAARRQAVRDAVVALGYSDAEIEAMLDKWNNVGVTVAAQALVPVKTPR